MPFERNNYISPNRRGWMILDRVRDPVPDEDEKFDHEKWFNDTWQAMRSQESVDDNLVDMEIAPSLGEQSAAALLRVPRAIRDIVRLRDDAVSLRSSISAILQKLKKAVGSSADSIAALAKIDIVKQRIEAACKILQDAAGLTQLSPTVEVAEFANVRKQLEVLEDRLVSMVQPRLTDALLLLRSNGGGVIDLNMEEALAQKKEDQHTGNRGAESEEDELWE